MEDGQYSSSVIKIFHRADIGILLSPGSRLHTRARSPASVSLILPPRSKSRSDKRYGHEAFRGLWYLLQQRQRRYAAAAASVNQFSREESQYTRVLSSLSLVLMSPAARSF